jgi:predicted HTH transcriptional regulator
MIEKLVEIIKYHSESVYVDFKSQEYPLGKNGKKNEILKDISAMANHPSNEPKYIVIGII